jgi:hypothetical protein
MRDFSNFKIHKQIPVFIYFPLSSSFKTLVKLVLKPILFWSQHWTTPWGRSGVNVLNIFRENIKTMLKNRCQLNLTVLYTSRRLSMMKITLLIDLFDIFIQILQFLKLNK